MLMLLYVRMHIIRFARDGANFSLSTDDPTITGTGMEDEYRLVRGWGLSEAHLVRAVRERVPSLS